MDLSFIVRQLRGAGARVEIGGVSGADLTVDGDPVQVKIFHRDPTPSDVAKTRERDTRSAGTLLISARRTSPALADLAMRDRALIVVSEEDVIYQGQRVRLADRQTRARSQRGPRPYARFAVGRALLAVGKGATQQVIAAAAGVSQATVSQTVGEWRDTRDEGELFDRLVREYPGPGGIELYWWSDAPLRDQATDLREVGALISGDLAASAINGWRLPERAIAYTRNQVDLAAHAYVLATPLDYTMRMVVPHDPTLWATSAAFGRPGIADPVVSAHDILRTATTGDQDQAVAKLRETVGV